MPDRTQHHRSAPGKHRDHITTPPAPAPDASAAPPVGQAVDGTSVVHAAVYRDGHRVTTPTSPAETDRRLREQPDGMAWIDLHRPSDEEPLSLTG